MTTLRALVALMQAKKLTLLGLPSLKCIFLNCRCMIPEATEKDPSCKLKRSLLFNYLFGVDYWCCCFWFNLFAWTHLQHVAGKFSFFFQSSLFWQAFFLQKCWYHKLVVQIIVTAPTSHCVQGEQGDVQYWSCSCGVCRHRQLHSRHEQMTLLEKMRLVLFDII